MPRTRVKSRAALGFRVHSGWAALVVVAGLARSPEVIERHRIELTKPGIPRQPYHAAEGMELKAAEKFLRRCTNAARLLARQAVRAAIANLRKKGYAVVGSAILLASGRPLPALAATLASHALIHTAEGELFREALIHASEQCHLSITRLREREVYVRGATELAIPVHKLRGRLNELGQPLGPPWRQDEKLAALAGWLVLGGAFRR